MEGLLLPILSPVLIGWTNNSGWMRRSWLPCPMMFSLTVKEARVKLRERALITLKINSRAREYCCRTRERERERENETDKKCIILRKNELKKVLKQFRKEIIPSKILWYFFFFPFLRFNEVNECRLLWRNKFSRSKKIIIIEVEEGKKNWKMKCVIF